jgi:internalin A
MTEEENAYKEALRRIREAEETGAVELDFRGLSFNGLPPELERLTWLQSLDLGDCEKLRDLTPLAKLTSLQSLDLHRCGDLCCNLTPLAALTLLQSLDLFGCYQLRGDLTPLADLTSLQSLNLGWLDQLCGNLSPLASLTSLQSLDLCRCEQQLSDLSYCQRLSDISPLANITSLQTLDLTGCSFRRFAPLESLLPTLKDLRLFDCKLDDLPPEVCGDRENVLDKVRAHYKDLKSGQRIDAEVKVLFLGNGGVGKTQLCRRLRDLPFDPNIPSTHGIQLGQTTVTLENFPEPVRLNLWDFGGQDIYHGSHALFLHGQAIFLVLWMPELEHQATYQEGGAYIASPPAFLLARLPTVPLPEKMLPCSSYKASAIHLDQNWALEAIYALFDRKKILPLLPRLHN